MIKFSCYTDNNQCYTVVAQITTNFFIRSEEHTSEPQSPCILVCRLLLEKKTHYPAVRPWQSLSFRMVGHLPGSLPHARSQDHTPELQSPPHLVCRRLLHNHQPSPFHTTS